VKGATQFLGRRINHGKKNGKAEH